MKNLLLSLAILLLWGCEEEKQVYCLECKEAFYFTLNERNFYMGDTAYVECHDHYVEGYTRSTQGELYTTEPYNWSIKTCD